LIKEPRFVKVAFKMESQFQTPQEIFWAQEFGDQYTERNNDPQLIASNLALFTKVLAQTVNVKSVLELGANRGLNLQALHQLLPSAYLAGIEINAQAAEALRSLEYVDVHHASLLDFSPAATYSLALIKGVLIHIQPEQLPKVYNLLAAASSRYVCIAEYYNPSPVSLEYRGHADRLFKRDFAGEFLQRHPEFRLLNYGFVYRRDPQFPLDDITWFLMERGEIG
jgi:pseudaminic acid biosynthesis-associated methylase